MRVNEIQRLVFFSKRTYKIYRVFYGLAEYFLAGF